MFPPPNIKGKIMRVGCCRRGDLHAAGELADQLEKAGVPWEINGMSWTTYRNKADAYLEEALDVTGQRIRATEWLMDNSDWDLMARAWVRSTAPSMRSPTTSRPTTRTPRSSRKTASGREGARRLQAARRRDRLVRRRRGRTT